MNESDKNQLVAKLIESQASLRAPLEGTDLDIRVYEESDWCIKDLLSHLALWDRQVTLSLIAFKAGEEYSIPELDIDAFNQQDILMWRDKTDQQVLEEWEQARKALIASVQEIPLDRFPGDMLYPWTDERGSIPTLVRYMVEHDIEHRDEIFKVLQTPNTD